MTLYNKNAPETIQAMFGSIAKSYDRTNALLSFQLHRLWNRRLVDAVIKGSNAASCVADLCCGTGAIAFTWLKKAKPSQTAYLIDFCPEMLACAKFKADRLKLDAAHHLSYIQADVQALPLANDSIDCMTMAYGIRNVKTPLLCFQEAFRALKKGGTLGILELTEPRSAFLRFGHRLYLKAFLPTIGKLLTSDRQAYEYLSRSIGAFTKPEELAILLRQAGFGDIQITPLTGGIATLLIARKAL